MFGTLSLYHLFLPKQLKNVYTNFIEILSNKLLSGSYCCATYENNHSCYRDGPYHRVRDYYVQAQSSPVLDEELVNKKLRLLSSKF